MANADPLSVQARAAWNQLAGGLPPHARSGFRPFNDWVGPWPQPLAGEGAMKVFALVTPAGQFYSMVVFSNMVKQNRVRIAAVQQRADTLPGNGQI